MWPLNSSDRVLLPRNDHQRDRSEKGLVPAAPGDIRILLVDDDVRSRTVLRLVLRRRGFDVLEADDGDEAQDLYCKHGESIALVLLAARMSGWDGPATLEALRVLNPHVCCCFMGDNLGSFSMAALQQLGPAAIFSKPFDLPEIVDVLTQLGSSTRATSPAE